LRWIATPEKDAATVTIEKRLWDAADQFRANSGLKPQEYSGPTLGLLFLRFAEHVCRRRPHGYELCSECICP
jgi:type I restriction enzyme M protein